MPLDPTVLAPRAAHLATLLVTRWTLVGLLLGAAVWLVSGRLRSAAVRDAVLAAASLAALAWFATPGVAALWLGYALVFYAAVEYPRRGWVVAPAVAALLGAQVVLPVLALEWLGTRGAHVREFTAFASSMAVLRFHAYAWDRWRRGAPRAPLIRFLAAMFFFPTFVNGPVEVPRDFESGWLGAAPEARRAALAGLGRVALGCAKMTLVALAFAPGWTSALGEGATVPPARLWLWGVLLYVWFYGSFSAWTDIAIGLAAIAGRRAPENFAAPWAALDPGDFWRRWHRSLGFWLRDYVYIPLGGGRRRRAANVLAVFVVSALWHVWGSVKLLGFGYFPPRAWGGFLLWGCLNALGVIAARPLERALPATTPGRRLARSVGTFLFESLCWIPFFLPGGVGPLTALTMLFRMICPF